MPAPADMPVRRYGEPGSHQRSTRRLWSAAHLSAAVCLLQQRRHAGTHTSRALATAPPAAQADQVMAPSGDLLARMEGLRLNPMAKPFELMPQERDKGGGRERHAGHSVGYSSGRVRLCCASAKCHAPWSEQIAPNGVLSWSPGVLRQSRLRQPRCLWTQCRRPVRGQPRAKRGRRAQRAAGPEPRLEPQDDQPEADGGKRAAHGLHLRHRPAGTPASGAQDRRMSAAPPALTTCTCSA